jgi:hypothetical protein
MAQAFIWAEMGLGSDGGLAFISYDAFMANKSPSYPQAGLRNRILPLIGEPPPPITVSAGTSFFPSSLPRNTQTRNDRSFLPSLFCYLLSRLFSSLPRPFLQHTQNRHTWNLFWDGISTGNNLFLSPLSLYTPSHPIPSHVPSYPMCHPMHHLIPSRPMCPLAPSHPMPHTLLPSSPLSLST